MAASSAVDAVSVVSASAVVRLEADRHPTGQLRGVGPVHHGVEVPAQVRDDGVGQRAEDLLAPGVDAHEHPVVGPVQGIPAAGQLVVLERVPVDARRHPDDHRNCRTHGRRP